MSLLCCGSSAENGSKGERRASGVCGCKKCGKNRKKLWRIEQKRLPLQSVLWKLYPEASKKKKI